ncbi:MAG: sulfatase-like hydrolase/transferase [Verrucomicrobiota bacterium]|nr:sulfatase-like hydrolase/transferase [Verrucomicrobiota bacterium]
MDHPFKKILHTYLTLRFLVCSLGQALLVFTVTAASNQRPNIVFVFSDDHAVQAIGAYGSKVNQTPHIDRLAKEGALYVNSFCANSICGPSRACILTGKHSHRNGFLRNGDRFDGTQTTFPKLLQGAGYKTAMIGKWHLGTDPTGFDYWEVLPGQGNYYNPDLIQMDGSRKRYEGYCTDLITDLAIDWLKEQKNKDAPFMLMCQHKAPHRNWSPHPRHFGRYKLGTIPEPESLFDDYSGRSKLLTENEMTLKQHFHWGHDTKFHGENQFTQHFSNLGNGEYRRMTDAQKGTWDAYYEAENQSFIHQMKAGELSEQEIVQWKYQRYMHDYLGSVQAVDDSVGRILDYLDQNGLSENTLVIYSSDQGFYLGEHGWYDKRWMFEESLKMPFIARWPGKITPGTRSEAMIQNIDYGPTFLDLADVPVPHEMQGRSLKPLFENGGMKTPDWRDAIYYAYYENAAVHAVPIHDGVRTQRHKLMFFPRTHEWNLYDLVADPHEMRSVHEQSDYEPVLAALMKRYQDIKGFYGVNSAVIPNTRGDEKWWKERDREKKQVAKKRDIDLAFIGDSITQGWEGSGQSVWDQFYAERKSINLGFSGDRTEHVVWRLNKGQLDHITPKVAVVLIGTNNTGHRMQDPAETAEGIERILDILKDRSPETKALLLGVFPRGRSAHDLGRITNQGINQIIRRFHDGKRVHYLDISEAFLDENGDLPASIMPDALHLNKHGYQLWAEAMEPKLRELGL